MVLFVSVQYKTVNLVKDITDCLAQKVIKKSHIKEGMSRQQLNRLKLPQISFPVGMQT